MSDGLLTSRNQFLFESYTSFLFPVLDYDCRDCYFNMSYFCRNFSSVGAIIIELREYPIFNRTWMYTQGGSYSIGQKSKNTIQDIRNTPLRIIIIIRVIFTRLLVFSNAAAAAVFLPWISNGQWRNITFQNNCENPGRHRKQIRIWGFLPCTLATLLFQHQSAVNSKVIM